MSEAMMKTKEKSRPVATVITRTFTAPPILGCLKAAEEFTGRPLKFKWSNERQERFVKDFAGRIDDLKELKDEIQSIADQDVEVINKFLRDRGFDIQLRPTSGTTFSVASVLDILVEWIEEGKKRDIWRLNGDVRESYPGVYLKAGVLLCDGLGWEPLVKIATKSGKDEVWIMPLSAETEVNDDLDIPLMIKQATLELEDYRHDEADYDEYEGVVFPMIDYNREVDISWLQGLWVNDTWWIEEAIQQTKFRMNEKGARAQSAVAMTMRCLSLDEPKKPVVIDKPFLLWISRKGVSLPVFAGVFAKDAWRRPEEL